MSEFQKEVIVATAKEFGYRAYKMGGYVLVLDTMGEEFKCKSLQALFDWMGVENEII